ncbi:MAG TPA: AtpZ/AtpI family protein [Acidimicrobiales bacterium]|nr:AtpZ/AtpI family protein [Acidimicrobiales bacterium]
MDAIEERRKLYAGFGETFSRAVEFVATPAIFGFGGHLLDGRLRTAPLFMLALTIFAVVGMFLRFLMNYSQAMDAEQSKGPWRPTSEPPR